MMSFLASLFPHKQQNQPHQSCGCVCHEDTTVTRPTTWLERIRRRSSISSTQLLYENSSTESVQCSVEEKNLNDFTDLYDLAVDEIRYATEFQGSIYYDSDLLEAKEAVIKCLDSFQCLILALPAQKSNDLQQKWSILLTALRTSLDALPLV